MRAAQVFEQTARLSLTREVGTATYKLLTPEDSPRIRQSTGRRGWRAQLTGMVN